MTIDFDDEMTDEFEERFDLYAEPPDETNDSDTDEDETTAGPDATGPLTAEAVRLVASLQDWVRRTAAETQDGHTGPECQWCPLCQFVAVLRGERPEITERVAEAGVAIATAMRSLLDATAGAPQGGAHRAEEGDEAAGDDPTPRVQHIRLGDAFGTAGTD